MNNAIQYLILLSTLAFAITTAACNSSFNAPVVADVAMQQAAQVEKIARVAAMDTVPLAVVPTASAGVKSAAIQNAPTQAKPTVVGATTKATLSPTTTVAPAKPTSTQTATAASRPTNLPTPTTVPKVGCPAIPPPPIKSSGLVKSATMAQRFDKQSNQPVNPTTVFQSNSEIHSVVALQNAPANTKVKAAWYATDVGNAAPCNTFIDQAEITDDTFSSIDFTLNPSNPVGSYRVEISVNGNLEQVVNFSVR